MKIYNKDYFNSVLSSQQKLYNTILLKYGKIVTNVDFTALIEMMQDTPLPEHVAYEPSVEAFESLAVFKQVQTVTFGEMPIQIGYCNGNNYRLNALEYHETSEINVAATDAVFLLGAQQDITEDFTYDTAKVEAFFLPKGCALELYAMTLHYAPCNGEEGGFHVAIILPKGTNYPLTATHTEGEDRYLAAINKRLLGHTESNELPKGTQLIK